MNLFSIFLWTLLAALAVLFGLVMYCPSVEDEVSQLLGLQNSQEKAEKDEVLKFLGIAMGGVLVALQALASHKRAKAMEDTAQHTEKGQRQERLKNAIEHLGNPSDSVRLGGAYELFHLAEDTEELRQTVLDILCAHIRRTTGKSKYREKHRSKPSEEVQSLLTLLFVQKHEVFRGLHISLRGSWLNGSHLHEARLEKAVLAEVYLQRADLVGAQLQETDLGRAQLEGVLLVGTQLQGAGLMEARLQGADLGGVQLQRANLTKAQLQGALLRKAQLQGANLTKAQLQGANLTEAQLQGVTASRSPSSTFEERIRGQIGKESALSSVIFANGLSQESGAITGTYTAEEAEQWIAEYEEVMSVFNEADAN